ncbi:MAG: hypothetical protein H6812_05315 [Phycisphaeraceae bacterium]|nr:hypothetical protein [Phycisphaerales bacterium]MCB9842660.1 hypothetical protein [Phycisphaeraceae bacterium]
MYDAELREYEPALVTPESREFAKYLFERFSQFQCFAKMERSPGTPWNLIVEIPSPIGVNEMNLLITVEHVDDMEEPSVFFGRWHTHERCETLGRPESSPHVFILDLIEGIISDRYALANDPVPFDSEELLDLDDPDSILDALTCRYSPDAIVLRSWTGKHNRTVRIEDLNTQ